VSGDEPLALTAEERAALIWVAARDARICPLPARAAARPLEGDPGQARTAVASARTAAAAASRRAACRAREVETAMNLRRGLFRYSGRST
jgi:hypothetical protein